MGLRWKSWNEMDCWERVRGGNIIYYSVTMALLLEDFILLIHLGIEFYDPPNGFNPATRRSPFPYKFILFIIND